MSTVEKNEVREENVSRETIDDKPVEVELPLGLDEKDKKSEQVTEVKEEKKEDDEVTEYSKKVQTRINQITDRYRKEQRDKEEAVRLAKQLKDQNSKLETQIQNLDKGYISEYGTRIESQLASASEAYKKALEVNDTDAMVKASQAIAKVTIEQERHRIAKQRQEDQDVSRETIQTQPPVQTQAQPAPEPDPKAKAWAEKNIWFGENDEMTALAFGVDKKLQQEGFDLGSDEYYSELDKRIRKRFPEEFQEEKTSSVNRVAPADSTASRSNSKGRRTVKLTPSQVQMAKRLNVPLEEYAKYVKE
tara:strand:- start:2150 stop:3061 length:912 start_codon:yes stop_codon:yes gene_type:complete